jgi:flavodoxin
MKDALVVYYSRSGYTHRVAEGIASRLDADVEAIREQRSRRGWRGYWRSAREALGGTLVDIAPAGHHPRDYGLVVIGTPVWAGNIASPVRAFIGQHRSEFGEVALFCTQGGSGGPKVLQRMADLCDRRPVATAWFNDSEIDAGKHAGKLEDFVKALRLPRP